jgi:hypothetical protein
VRIQGNYLERVWSGMTILEVTEPIHRQLDRKRTQVDVLKVDGARLN